MYKHVQLDVYSSVKLMHKHYLKLFILKYLNIDKINNVLVTKINRIYSKFYFTFLIDL